MPASARSIEHDATVPSIPQQQGLPTGPTHVASRSTPPPRTAAEVESNRAFLAAAGRVEFGRYEATLRDIWMAFAYFASLSDARECYGTGEHIAEKARRSGRTVRRHVPALIDRGLIQSDNRKGGHDPSTWKVVLPADVRVGLTSVSPDVRGGQDVRAGRTGCPGRADTVSDDIRNREKVESTSSSRARVVCPECRHDWLAEDQDGQSYGTKCHNCGHDPSTWTPADDTPADTSADRGKQSSTTGTITDEPTACTCGDAYRNAYGRRCLDCDGEPSPAQRDALREKHGGGGGTQGGGGVDGGGLTTPHAAAADPPRAEPGPNETQFYQQLFEVDGEAQGGDNMTDHRTPVERSMNEKILNIVKGDGEGDGLTLTPAEATAFKLMMGAMHQRQVDTDGQLTIAQGVNRAMREAITRQGFQLTHQEHSDGSVSYDLQNAPQPTPEIVN